MKSTYNFCLINIILIGLLSGCKNVKVEAVYPKDSETRREERVGSLVNEDPKGGIVLFGKGNSLSGKNSSNVQGSVNSYLWHAALNVLDFMPIQSSDSVGGVLVTDWYEYPRAPGERIKVNVIIMGSELRTEALKVKVFKQLLNNKIFVWRDIEVSDNVARELEDKILTKARQLRIAKEIK
ncbi:MAG: DUF3576 domain-containing protein [Rickettsiales endosymbiont of Dermacentor nuttalli]